MKEGKYILAIDLGTSGPKTALVSTSGEVAGSEFEETPVILLPGGGAEQDPEGWWKAVMKAACRLLTRELVPVEDIAAVSVTTQWSGTVPVDESGDHLMNAIIWMDCRGAEALRESWKSPVKIAGFPPLMALTWLKYTGGLPTMSGKDPIAHILWLKRYRPEIYRRTFKFLEPKDYINLRLTGRFAATFDSILLHWVTDNRDPSRVRYHPRLLEMAGIERSKLPDLIRAVDILGPLKDEVAREMGLKPGTPVIGGTPDVPSACVGSGAVRDFEGHLYIGTSSWISAHVPFKKTDIFHCLGSFPSPVPGRYLILDEQECAGKCLTWLRDNVLYHHDELLQEENVPDIFKVMDRIVSRVPAGANNVIFTPWLYGERTPVENCHIRSSLFNLSLENTREDIARAVFEGVAFNQKWLLSAIERFMGRRFEYLNFIGGGANSGHLVPDHRRYPRPADPPGKGAGACQRTGAAFLAAIALGLITVEDIPGSPGSGPSTCRTRTTASSDEIFAEFKNLYKVHSRICSRMNRKNASAACEQPLQGGGRENARGV